jgi:hypothetical protein
MSETKTIRRDREHEQRLFTFKATQLIWLALGIVEALIALRVILKLIGANPASLFAAFIYNLSDIFLFPFAGLVGTPTSGNMSLEFSSIIAMFVYALLAWIVERIVWLIFYRPRGSVVGMTQTVTNTPVEPEPDIIIETATTRNQLGD